MDATSALLADLRRYVREHHLGEAAQLREALAHCLLKLLRQLEQPLQADTHKPFVIMLCGVNGAGKTTSIGKLAKHLQEQGLSVLLAAGDTFRAAAREQLMTWGERNNVTVIAQQSGDAAAVICDAARDVTGLILTTRDGTAKSGVVTAMARAHPIPVGFSGVGEGLDGLRPF